jgi:hypothetical protein
MEEILQNKTFLLEEPERWEINFKKTFKFSAFTLKTVDIIPLKSFILYFLINDQ